MDRCPEWLDIFIYGMMKSINSKGEMKDVPKQTEDVRARHVRKSAPYKREDGKKKRQPKDAKKKQGFARNIK